MKNFLIKCIFLACFLVNAVSSMAQVDREFWFAIPKETYGHPTPAGSGITAANTVSFKIAAMSLPAKVTISMPANPAPGFTPITVNVPAGTSTVVDLATDYQGFEKVYNNTAAYNAVSVSGKTNKGILIQSDNDITIYYDYDNLKNMDEWYRVYTKTLFFCRNCCNGRQHGN